jgi:hypothetical protein
LKKHIIIVLIFLCGNTWVSAQGNSIAQTEKELVQIYGKAAAFYYGDFDSLDYYSKLFSSKLEALISSDPKTLQYTFSKLTAEHVCFVKTSKDGLFRIYSWDTQSGGTMHFFRVIYQYKSGKTVKTQHYYSDDEGDPAWFCSEIFTLKTKKEKYYLAITNGIYSTKDVGQGIKAFELTNQDLNDSILLMKTSEGLKNSLDIAFDFFSVSDNSERPAAVISYDNKKKMISVKCVGDKGEIVDSCHKIYTFTGMYFENTRTNMR